jgi:hypothetical protein
MIALIDRNPDIYIDEIADQLYTLHNVEVSLPTVYRAMKEVGFAHKKVDFFIGPNSQPLKLTTNSFQRLRSSVVLSNEWITSRASPVNQLKISYLLMSVLSTS